jgi:SAM-dependent methyltransferase
MARCPVCGFENAGSPLFCGRCTSPLGVVALHELDETDQRRCLSALFEVLREPLGHKGTGGESRVDAELWGAYLNAFWLRPETALILYAEALAIRSMNLASAGPWLDLGCGDGIHAALYSGWRFEAAFDAFSCLDLSATDIYNRFEPAEFSAPIERSGRRIEYGIDIKPTAVARAKALGVFENVQQADATALPMDDSSVGVIFSNMLRDLGEPLGAALPECSRILRKDGVLLLSAMTPAYAEHLYFAPAAHRAEQGGDSATAAELLKLDRGRSIFCQQQLSLEQWANLFENAGLRLFSARTIVGPAIIRFWDVGLRPFAHALLAQRQTWLDAGILPAVKRSLLSGMNYLLRPLLDSLVEGTPCMQLLEVRKE